MCPDIFYQQMGAAQFESDIFVTDLLDTGADTSVQTYGINWTAQTFQPSEAYSISGVNLALYRTGNPGNITVALRATVAGLPSGANLASNTYDGNSLTSATTGEWIAVAFTSDYALTAGTTYAIVVSDAGGALANRINWFADTNNGYANGQECTSVNSGANWAAVPANDMMFEVLARGGTGTYRGNRIEGSLSGTTFDTSQIATNWGTSNMWISTLMWVIMMGVLSWAMALATNSWDCTVLVIAICTAYGWRTGFIDTVFMASVFSVLAIGTIYAAFWKKSY
jgi:hypothetical protein